MVIQTEEVDNHKPISHEIWVALVVRIILVWPKSLTSCVIMITIFYKGTSTYVLMITTQMTKRRNTLYINYVFKYV